MKFSYLCFGFCFGMAISSLIHGEVARGLIQMLGASLSLPGMLFGGK